jgi:hypothetical protein
MYRKLNLPFNLAFILLIPVAIYAQVKISQMPLVTTLAGTEEIPAVQSLQNVSVTPHQLAQYAFGTFNDPTSFVINGTSSAPGLQVNSPNGAAAVSIKAIGTSTAAVDIEAINLGTTASSIFDTGNGSVFGFFELQGTGSVPKIAGGFSGSALNIGTTGAPMCFGANHNCEVTLTPAGNFTITAPTSGPALTVAGSVSLSSIASTTTAPAAGAAGALPAAPTGYMTITVNGTPRQVAFY